MNNIFAKVNIDIFFSYDNINLNPIVLEIYHNYEYYETINITEAKEDSYTFYTYNVPYSGLWTFRCYIKNFSPNSRFCVDSLNIIKKRNYNLQLSDQFHHNTSPILGVYFSNSMNTKLERLGLSKYIGQKEPITAINDETVVSESDGSIESLYSNSNFDCIDIYKDITKYFDNRVTGVVGSAPFIKIESFGYKIISDNNSNILKLYIISSTTAYNMHPAPAFKRFFNGDISTNKNYVFISSCLGSYKNDNTLQLKEDTYACIDNLSNYRTKINDLNSQLTGYKLYLMDYATLVTIWMLYLVEFADFNAGDKIGIGATHDEIKNGQTNIIKSIGNYVGTGTINSSRRQYKAGITYRGIENLWAGNQSTILEGIAYSLADGSLKTQDINDYGTDNWTIVVTDPNNIANMSSPFINRNFKIPQNALYNWFLYPNYDYYEEYKEDYSLSTNINISQLYNSRNKNNNNYTTGNFIFSRYGGIPLNENTRLALCTHIHWSLNNNTADTTHQMLTKTNLFALTGMYKENEDVDNSKGYCRLIMY